MPSFRACWRSAPTVRFICFEIFETGVLAFECFRSSACIAFVHAAPLRLIFFFVALAIYPSKFVRRSITHQQINANRGSSTGPPCDRGSAYAIQAREQLQLYYGHLVARHRGFDEL